MNRMELLLHQLEITYDKEDWYPPLVPALAGVTAEQASWRPPGAAVNTIGETVNHLLFYKERVLQRLRGSEPTSTAANNDETFSAGAAADAEQSWQETLNRLQDVHQQIRETLAGMDDNSFDQPIPQTPMGILMTSILLHDAYHTGQIIQLRKLQGSWPTSRTFA
ncbi:DinB family protein [Brevibacillus humidisoli]|uniref:DinB family protein n=1 Tax=Brevibacillus humidisoli TaxID=2895522 RepID=UPI001E5F8513|nr:DinB family protein [Brevibacillus humidisoli]UFJ41381.1 DinB family protein [Brevibacillus humidisoli]